MKYFVLSLLLVISTDPRDIAKVNSIKKEAEKAFLSGKYDEAAINYLKLDSLKVDDPALKLNMGHAYFHLKDTAAAKGAYQSATTTSDKQMKSIAYQQLGVMDKQANKLEDALKNLKASLKADPTNEGARYDYELVKKLLEKKEEEQKDQNQDQQQDKNEENKDQQQNEQKDNQEQNGEKSDEQKEQEKQEKESEEKDGEKKEGENEEGEEKESDEQPKTPEEELKEKLKEMNMSEEKAQMILEALRNNEIQYIQQQKRKATKRPPSGKPDW